MRSTYDIVIVGGGINGCGIARDATGRGLSVLLAEQNDLASGTSSASTKLIHGGLRYLEHYAFRLVRESLKEREVLRRLAPHIVRPMRFVLPHVAMMRPAWLIRCGLFLYDYLATGTLAPTTKINLAKAAAGLPFKKSLNTFSVGFEYSDCWADDARLVVANAQDAAHRGGIILPRTRCVSATTKGNGWEVTLQRGDDRFSVGARCLVNATGPWANTFLQEIKHPPRRPLRLVQGSHLVAKKLYDGEHAYLLQNKDGRVVFTIPYENDWTLIGTTDHDFSGDPATARVSEEEYDYLQNTVMQFFGNTAQIVHKFCGVRALADGDNIAAQKANRDYLLDLEDVNGSPLLNIYGGKLTTYRRLAEAAMQKLCGKGRLFTDASGAWSATTTLPGGNLPAGGVAAVAQALTAADTRLTAAHATRLARAYGTAAASLPPPGDWHCLGADLYDWEVDYLMREEWAQTPDDVLWRRSKLGLRLDAAAIKRLQQYMKAACTNDRYP